MKIARSMVLVSSGLLSFACTKAAPPEVAPSDPRPIPTTAAVAVDGGPGPDRTLFGMLGAEAAARPKLSPGADDVYAALDKAGYAVGDRRQSLGRTYKASYCAGGYTKDMALA